MAVTPVCVFVGAPAAGKTTIGQAVAEALNVEFRDTDADIVAAAGKEIPDIFVDDGEDVFRAFERAAVSVALESFAGVLALGSGAILDPETREQLATHTVVYLTVELTDAISRVGMGSSRPLLRMNPRATLKYLMDQRRPLYEQVATLTIATDGRDPKEIAAGIVEALPPR